MLYLVNRTQRAYLLLGAVMIGAGICIFVPTQLKYFVLPYPRLWYILTQISLNIMLISLLAFYEHIFTPTYRLILRRLWQCHLIYALIPPLGNYLTLSTLGISELLILLVATLHGLFQRNVESGIFVGGFAIFAPFRAIDGLLNLGLFPLSTALFHFGMLTIIIAFSFILIRRFVLVYQQIADTNDALARFVPTAFLNYLGRKNIIDIQLGDQIQTSMTILFSDIRAFTTLSEQMTPQETFNFINDYLKQVSPIIRQHQGFIDKYIGDAIMALFPDCTDDSLQAAIAMQQAVLDFNIQRQELGQPPISIGLALHTGSLMLGTIGEQKRMESTVISDAVNLASRLEGLTKYYGVGLIISETTLACLADDWQKYCRFLDRVKVKGKTEAISIFEIFRGDTAKIIRVKQFTKGDFERGVKYYRVRHFDQAEHCLKRVLSAHPDDKAAKIYLERIQRFRRFGVPMDWDGVEALTEK